MLEVDNEEIGSQRSPSLLTLVSSINHPCRSYPRLHESAEQTIWLALLVLYCTNVAFQLLPGCRINVGSCFADERPGGLRGGSGHGAAGHGALGPSGAAHAERPRGEVNNSE